GPRAAGAGLAGAAFAGAGVRSPVAEDVFVPRASRSPHTHRAYDEKKGSRVLHNHEKALLDLGEGGAGSAYVRPGGRLAGKRNSYTRWAVSARVELRRLRPSRS